MVRKYQPVGGNYALKAENDKELARSEPKPHQASRSERQDPNTRFYSQIRDRYQSGRTRFDPEPVGEDKSAPRERSWDDLGSSSKERSRNDLRSPSKELSRDNLRSSSKERSRNDLRSPSKERSWDDLGSSSKERSRNNLRSPSKELSRDDLRSSSKERSRNDLRSPSKERSQDDLGSSSKKRSRDDLGSSSKERSWDNLGSSSKGGHQETSVLTMNLNGKSVMGLTPKYKLRMIEDFLKAMPDVVFFQDSIDLEDLSPILDDVSDKQYDSFFQAINTKDEDDGQSSRSITGIAWNKDKYNGTPLQLEDDRLGDHVGWLLQHDLTIVKLDPRDEEGANEPFPSFVAISWHGADYKSPLRQRIKECEQLFAFLTKMRANIRNIPILIGADFNMDMKSFDVKNYPEFLLVPYRPVSGSLTKDMKNIFMVTKDSLQVIETGFKQHHPEIFSSPFITAKVRMMDKQILWQQSERDEAKYHSDEER